MQKLKTERGITLIALIITIIVMLILVGVTVNISLNGGLFNTVKQSVDQTQMAAEKEQLLLAVMGSIENGRKVNYTKLDNNLPEGFEGSQGIYTNTKSGNKYKVNEYGTIEILKAIEIIIGQYKKSSITITPMVIDWETVLTEEDAVKMLVQDIGMPEDVNTLEEFNLLISGETSYDKLKDTVSSETGIKEPTDQDVFNFLVNGPDSEEITTPQKFVASLLEVDNGTSDGENITYRPKIKLAVNDDYVSEIDNQNGFEYAVQAGKEYKIQIEINGIIETKTLEIQEGMPYNWDENKVDVRTEGETCIPIPKGFEVSTATTEDSVEEGLVIKDGENEFVWVPVENAGAYEEDGFVPIVNSDSYPKIQYYYGESLGTINNDTSFNETFSYELDKENVERSIQTYGGFYVGKYETTYDSVSNEIPQGIGVKKGKNVLQASNKLKVGTINGDEYHYRWWGLYKIQKDLYKNNANVGSLMISSKQWDVIMEFTDYREGQRPSQSYTNEPDKSGLAYNTDSTKYDEVKNIYDLAGNLSEWTLSHDKFNDERIVRGGFYDGSNLHGTNKASYNSKEDYDAYGQRLNRFVPHLVSDGIGSRCTLYIK